MSERRKMTTRPLSWWANHFKYQYCTDKEARQHIRALVGNNKAIVRINGAIIDFHPHDYILERSMLMCPQGEWFTGVYLTIDMEDTILFQSSLNNSIKFGMVY